MRRPDGLELILPELAVGGFALHRLHTDEPWFWQGEMQDAMQWRIKGTEVIDKGTVARAAGFLAAKGYLERERRREPNLHERPRIYYQATDAIVKPLVEGLTYYVTHRALTVSQILVLQEGVEAVIEHADFERHILRSILGEQA